MPGPRIVITVSEAARLADPTAAQRRQAAYAEAVARHGGQPVVLDPGVAAPEREAALAAMDGLLLAGGTDLDPARYGQPGQGSRDLDPDRDGLESEAWTAAEASSRPVLGICRGFQAINVFSGGRLVQDVAGHQRAVGDSGGALTHPLRVVGGTRLARILFPTNVRGGVLTVNSSHHQGVLPSGLAPGLIASATASSPIGELVEALETRAGRFVVGIQSHPERRESTPPAFERLFRVFVDGRTAFAAPTDARRR